MRLALVLLVASCGRVDFDVVVRSGDAAADSGGAGICGNSTIEVGEVCDDGNHVDGDGCSADCRSNETCGNGTIDRAAGETCDDHNTLSGDGCNSICQADELCGNTTVDAGEQCDGGGVFTPTCNISCTTSVCGDGVRNAVAGEQCDEGAANSNAPDAVCRPTCQLARCGDGIVDPSLGEQCDVGASNSNLPNAACRTNCLARRCGDGIIDNTFGETCDDGNTTPGDGCNATCTGP